ncbi:MAG: aspartate-semialdehyde dehydrogenase [Bacteroidales bacterium]|nr:aspartate-semialdehyde dehydrogenase [Bacteroidales bacterium]
MTIAVVGATGLVGSLILKVLEEQNLLFDTLLPVASEKSIGKTVVYNGKQWKVISVADAIAMKPDYAIFSAGKDVSRQYAKNFTQAGTTVIDNSSAWRMDNDTPLVVPEINAYSIENHKLIANPNCSTIGMVMALHNLHKQLKIKRLVISTYQSVSGSGIKGITQLQNERHGDNFVPIAYPHPIDLNIIPQGGNFLDNGYTEEEIKLENETHKILNDNSIKITSTVVRVPVTGGHSLSVNAEFYEPFSMENVINILNNSEGLIVYDDIQNNLYPMPIISEHKDEVFVGRIRRDFSVENGINLWITSDNLRKGAATNAVQILKYLIRRA